MERDEAKIRKEKLLHGCVGYNLELENVKEGFRNNIMIQEYLFTADAHRNIVEQYTPESCEKEIYDIDNSDCWIVTYSRSGENENSARCLSAAHNYVVSNFYPIVLSNGCSAYYNKALYPLFNEFERKLRKLLYLKSALSRDAQGSALIKDLESKDFGEIFTLLFSDQQFVRDTRTTVNARTWQFTKTEIIAAIQELSENTVWDSLIGKDAVPLLRSDFVRVQSYRNDIMHAHSMDTANYTDAAKLIKEINRQLDAEIGKIIGIKEEVKEDSAQNFNTALGDAIRNLDEAQRIKSWQEQMSALQSAIPSFRRDNLIPSMPAYIPTLDLQRFKAIQPQIPSSMWDSFRQSLQGLSKIQTSIPPALSELREIVASTQQPVLPGVRELQESILAFKQDDAVSELSQTLKELLEETHNGSHETGNA